MIKKVSLITVCHKSKKDIVRYVSSFLAFHSPEKDTLDYEFVFVENSGEPEIREVVQALSSRGYRVLVVDSENHGFGKGCNLGVEQSSGELLAFVNPDVRFMSSLNSLAEFTQKASWGTICQLTTAGRMHAVDILPENKTLLFEFFRGYRLVNRYPNYFMDSLYVVGSFLLVERNLFERSGGFNSNFFLYYEEAELCRRLHVLGGAPSVDWRASVTHDGFGSQASVGRTLKFEAQGFLTYCRTTLQPNLLRTRLRQLRVLGVFSKTAKLRYLALKEAV